MEHNWLRMYRTFAPRFYVRTQLILLVGVLLTKLLLMFFIRGNVTDILFIVLLMGELYLNYDFVGGMSASKKGILSIMASNRGEAFFLRVYVVDLIQRCSFVFLVGVGFYGINRFVKTEAVLVNFWEGKDAHFVLRWMVIATLLLLSIVSIINRYLLSFVISFLCSYLIAIPVFLLAYVGAETGLTSMELVGLSVVMNVVDYRMLKKDMRSCYYG